MSGEGTEGQALVQRITVLLGEIEALGSQVIKPNIVPWDAQDAPARPATLTHILIRISREALQGSSLDSLMQGICDCLVAELPVEIVSVLLLDDDNKHFVHEVYSGEFTQSPLAVSGTWPITVGAAGRCVQLRRPHLIRDIANDPDYVPGNATARSEYLVPIRHGSRLHGVLNLESSRTDFFGPEACAVFDAVADLVAGAIHFARMADELTAKGIRFQAVEARSSVRDRLRDEGVDGKLGGVNRFTSVADAIEDFQRTAI